LDEGIYIERKREREREGGKRKDELNMKERMNG
jgi:hypothetical protein